jgi:hypothetical protein
MADSSSVWRRRAAAHFESARARPTLGPDGARLTGNCESITREIVLYWPMIQGRRVLVKARAVEQAVDHADQIQGQRAEGSRWHRRRDQRNRALLKSVAVPHRGARSPACGSEGEHTGGRASSRTHNGVDSAPRAGAWSRLSGASPGPPRADVPERRGPAGRGGSAHRTAIVGRMSLSGRCLTFGQPRDGARRVGARLAARASAAATSSGSWRRWRLAPICAWVVSPCERPGHPNAHGPFRHPCTRHPSAMLALVRANVAVGRRGVSEVRSASAGPDRETGPSVPIQGASEP